MRKLIQLEENLTRGPKVDQLKFQEPKQLILNKGDQNHIIYILEGLKLHLSQNTKEINSCGWVQVQSQLTT